MLGIRQEFTGSSISRTLSGNEYWINPKVRLTLINTIHGTRLVVIKIKKRIWYSLGGFKNPSLFRRKRRDGSKWWWEYFQEIR